ncbi:MAG: M48 family metalloprotease [Deltaproteobacteria bacterium]|nr:M48 family metalloprotease [Deltaproteobacteria bacterium]
MTHVASPSIGALLRDAIADRCVIESESQWAGAQAKRVADKLNAVRASLRPYEPVVFWSPRVTAFTISGPYIFISRELQQRLPHDAALAFIIAHEMAHHDLGHVRKAPNHLTQAIIAATWHAITDMARHPEKEGDADRYALQLCFQAGYRPARCLEAFRILIHHSLDWGDIEGALGPSDDVRDEKPSRLGRLRYWWWQRRRGYDALIDRRKDLEAQAGLITPSTEAQDRAISIPYRDRSAPYHDRSTPAPGASTSARRELSLCASCGHVRVLGHGDRCVGCLRREFVSQHLDTIMKRRWRLRAC